MCEPVTLGLIAGTAAGGFGAAGTFGTALTAMQAISLGASVGGTVMSAGAAYQQSQANQQIAQNNAKVADYQAQDIQRRGEEDAQAVQRKAAALKSSQRVNLASKGLDLGYGTAADLQDQTDFFAQSDVATVRTNAAKDAWGKRAMGANYRAEASAQNPLMAGAGTLLSGAGQVADKWYSYSPPTAGYDKAAWKAAGYGK
jgi:hypothetical protein